MNEDMTFAIGSLDRVISELLVISDDKELDKADCQTLKHHAEDMKAAATLINSRAHERLLKIQQIEQNEREYKERLR